jgi:hypothetical protein
VTVLAALFGIIGGGMLLGGIYFSLSEPAPGWMPLLTGVVFGPLAIYLAYHLLRLTHWAWLTLLILTVLLLGSSIARAAAGPPIAKQPLVEIALELGLLLYLRRPAVRGAFTDGR